MKSKLIFALVLFAVGALLVTARDEVTQTIRYRIGSILKFDRQSGLADEDAAWSMNWTQLAKLAVLQSGTAATGNEITNKVTFTTSFSAAPVVVLTAGTNDLPYLITVTTTNFIIGTTQTNASVRWIAFGSP